MLTARFAQIREAYDILGDEGQRAIYDTAGSRRAVLQVLAMFTPSNMDVDDVDVENPWVSWVLDDSPIHRYGMISLVLPATQRQASSCSTSSWAIRRRRPARRPRTLARKAKWLSSLRFMAPRSLRRSP